MGSARRALVRQALEGRDRCREPSPRLAQLQLVLPPPPRPAGNDRPFVHYGAPVQLAGAVRDTVSTSHLIVARIETLSMAERGLLS